MSDDFMRICRICHEEWPATVEFFGTARNALGEPYLRRVCKACQGERKRKLKVILGPCPCQGCRRPVYLLRPWGGSGHPLLRWRHADGAIHRCEGYNVRVGISDANPDTLCDARSVADTSRAGVSRLEVSAP